MSPDPQRPLKGMLAAAAIKELAKYVLNTVERKHGATKVQPPEAVVLPPLKHYTFIPLTGQIICRVATEGEDTDSASRKTKGENTNSSNLQDKKAAGSGNEKLEAGSSSHKGLSWFSRPSVCVHNIRIHINAIAHHTCIY